MKVPRSRSGRGWRGQPVMIAGQKNIFESCSENGLQRGSRCESKEGFACAIIQTFESVTPEYMT
jgi:hypothetical protein